MAIDRRGFLLGASAMASLPAAPALSGEKLFVSSARANGVFQAVVFDQSGRQVAALDLPGRGHGAAVHPGGRSIVLFARRPGDFALAFEPHSGELAATLHAPEGRHFYGHGTFSANGRLLFTSENEYEAARGVIGVWDVQAGFARVGEWESHGVGPHDLCLIAGGDALAVANGGIETHPDTGRMKLNIPDMEPSLAILSARDGSLLKSCRLPLELHKLSIRHLAANRSGTIVAAMQYEGPEADRPPLVFTWEGGAPRLLEAPASVQPAMRNYCGAVAMDTSGSVMAASCPRGDLVTFWDVAEGRFLGSMVMPDGCGVVAAGGTHQFIVTSGEGERMLCDPVLGTRHILQRATGTQWDNHVVAL